jgi:hypothetical protein
MSPSEAAEFAKTDSTYIMQHRFKDSIFDNGAKLSDSILSLPVKNILMDSIPGIQ